MPSLFTFIRQDLRGALVASLLVLGHGLLLTAAKAPQEVRTDELVQALGTISALTMITILWITFTVLEAADATGSRMMSRWRALCRTDAEEMVEEGEEEDESSHIFCTTWIELALGITLLAFWALYHSRAEVIIAAFAPSRSAGLTLIRTSYTVAMTCLALLQLHLILSIAWYALWQGGVASSPFWKERTGWWIGIGRIRLSDKSGAGAGAADEDVSEKV